ncbi:MAG: DNA polymerase Y family protein [Dermatophilaceae bacterium]
MEPVHGPTAPTSRRVLAVWCPDWPVVAALAELGGDTAPGPSAVFAANVVQACDAGARAAGVRRGMRRRDAQARCPELAVLAANPDRDARAFEDVLRALEKVRPGVAPLRPGLVALWSPGRYYGGETEAAAVIAERLVENGVWDCRFGVADEMFTAVQAARLAEQQDSVVVPPGRSAEFLRELPVDVVDDTDAVSLLTRLGIRTLGRLAELPGPDVRARFGPQAAWVHRVVGGAGAEPLAAREPPPELQCHVDFEPPLDSAEAVCFSTRRTADRFVGLLARHGLVCTAVRVDVECDGEVASSRTWLHPRWFEPADLVDRLHWQLQGSLRVGDVQAPVERVRFVPETVESDAVRADGLWGNTDERVERGIARVQGLLGHEAVLRPVLQGGRSPADRQALVPWGERPSGLRPLDRPWPGRLPPPAPTRVLSPPWPAIVVGAGGGVVTVDERGVVSEPPTRFVVRAPARSTMTGITGAAVGRRPSATAIGALVRGHTEGSPTEVTAQPVAQWAGPWPVDELWWEQPSRRVARFQLVGVDGRAWLLVCDAGEWFTEAAYD